MNVFVIFPKPQCFNNKDMGLQRHYQDKFKKYLMLLKEAGCSIEVLLEDELANDFLAQLGITPKRRITCITKSDLDWIQLYRDIEELKDSVFSDYSSATQILYDANEKWITPLALLRENKMTYMRKRSEAYRKRYVYALDRYIKDSQCVLQFRVDNAMDRGHSVNATTQLGDGRLCIEVGLNSGMTAIYYGGTFITEDVLPTILNM